MSNLDKVVRIGKVLQASQKIMTDFKEKKISVEKMELELGNVLVKVRRNLL